MVSAPGLEHGLVGPSAAGDDADHGAAVRADGLLGARGQAELGGALLLVVRDEDGVVAGAAGEGAAVADLGLDGGADGTLGHGAHGHDVADGEGGCVGRSGSSQRKQARGWGRVRGEAVHQVKNTHHEV